MPGRRGTRHVFTYDGARKLSSVRLWMGSTEATDDIIQGFQAEERRGVGTSVAITQAYTLLDGPRTDVNDHTQLWLTSRGAPFRIRDGLCYKATTPSPTAPAGSRGTCGRATTCCGRCGSRSVAAGLIENDPHADRGRTASIVATAPGLHAAFLNSDLSSARYRMKRIVIIVALALAGCAPEGAREIDALGREYLSAAAAGDTIRLRAVSVGTQPLTYAAAIRARRPELLARPEKASREALEIRADTALVEFDASPDWRSVGMLMEKRAGKWKIVRIQVRHL